MIQCNVLHWLSLSMCLLGSELSKFGKDQKPSGLKSSFESTDFKFI